MASLPLILVVLAVIEDQRRELYTIRFDLGGCGFCYEVLSGDSIDFGDDDELDDGDDDDDDDELCLVF
ncbi:hypothetical protein Q3G72_022543 [Acer saccharum]|nr:hypothetical protein Q3G72_013480 [Acer saccharum]KAK1555154.1 hypothetical protein Q3G72_022543 [Acer saccharum]